MRGRECLVAVFWAATWGLGVAIGVAVGGWLTLVGGAGTPGVSALDFGEDLLLLPLAAGIVVFLTHLLGQVVLSSVRRRRAARLRGDDHEHHE